MTHDRASSPAQSSRAGETEAAASGDRDIDRGTQIDGNAVVIVYAVQEHLLAIKRIADRAKESLGFVPRGALVRAIARGEVFVAVGHCGVIGFCHFYRRRDGVSVIYHLAVAAAARRAGVGRHLTEAVLADAHRHRATAVRLKCPEGLEANRFYAAVGFSRGGIEPRQPRSLILWERTTPATGE